MLAILKVHTEIYYIDLYYFSFRIQNILSIMQSGLPNVAKTEMHLQLKHYDEKKRNLGEGACIHSTHTHVRMAVSLTPLVSKDVY